MSVREQVAWEQGLPADFFREEEREGFVVPAKMKRAWAAKLKMLSWMAEIFERRGLLWWADYGTLLGAVRHRGFIPWDDDIDICMPRADYEEGMALLAEELPAHCVVARYRTQAGSPWGFVCNRLQADYGETAEEARITEAFFGCPYICGIDVYPLDYVPAQGEQRAAWTQLLYLVKGVADNYDTFLAEGSLEEMLAGIEAAVGQELKRDEHCHQTLVWLLEQLSQTWRPEESVAVAELANQITSGEADRPLVLYGGTVWLPFEMTMLPVPAGYAGVLELEKGASWSVPRQGASAHGYPFYSVDEELIAAHRRERAAAEEETGGRRATVEQVTAPFSVPESYLQEEEREGFLVPEMMKRCWAAKLQLLHAIDEVCRRHGLTWYADYGTLLGAVRHRGFVPWDDDIDISMPRADYNRAIPILKQELPPGCILGVFGETQDVVVWTSVNNRRGIDMGDSEREAAVTAENYGCPYQISIDLFPLDYVPAGKGERDALLEIYRLLFRAVRDYEAVERKGLLAEYAEQIRALTGQEVPLGAEFRPALGRLASALAGMYTRGESVGVNNIGIMADHAPDQWRALEWYDGETVYLPFEMLRVAVPPGYMEIVRSIFGSNWMTPVRGTATHAYPCYREQEEEIRRYRADRGLSLPWPVSGASPEG